MITKKEVEVTLDELKTLLVDNFTIRADNDGSAFSGFFDTVAEGSSAFNIDGYSFLCEGYEHPDEQQGDGTKTLIFTVYKYEFNNSNFSSTVHSGTFQITGWYDSWDNGKTDGYWDFDIKKVVKREVTIENWVVEE